MFHTELLICCVLEKKRVTVTARQIATGRHTGNNATVVKHCHLVVKTMPKQLHMLYLLRRLEDNAADNKANNPQWMIT